MFDFFSNARQPIIVISAMQVEANLLLKKIEVKKKYKLNNISVFEGFLQKKMIVVAISGIGKVNAALAAQLLISKYLPKVVVNLGVAGSISNKVAIGDVIIAEKVYQSDFDLTIFGYRKGEVPEIPFGLQTNISQKDMSFQNSCRGNIITADQFDTNQKAMFSLAKQFSALAKDMESASIGQVCYGNGIPFDVIRGVSDLSGEKAGEEFNINLHLAIANSTEKFIDIYERVYAR